MFSHAQVLYSITGEHYEEQRNIDFVYVADRIFEKARNVTIRAEGTGKFVKLRLYFSMRWIMISEVDFTSGKAFYQDLNINPNSTLMSRSMVVILRKSRL